MNVDMQDVLLGVQSFRLTHKSAYIQLEQKEDCELCNSLKRTTCMRVVQGCSTCCLKERENGEKILKNC